MRQFLRLLAVAITIGILVATTYFLIKYNNDYIAQHPEISGEKIVTKKEKEKPSTLDITPETKENIELYAKEEKSSLISSIKSTINMNIIANVRKTINTNITKAQYNEVLVDLFVSGDSGERNMSGEESKKIIVPDTIPCTIQIAGSMIYIVPQIDGLDSFEYHYRGDNKLMAYVREFAGTSIKATYYFENGELLDKEVNTFDTKYSVNENTEDILKRANDFYNSFLKED